MYRDLVAMERRLDWTMTRKKAEVQDALLRNIPVSLSSNFMLCGALKEGNRGIKATRILRIFLSHTVSGQAWQQSSDATLADSSGESKPNLETGEGIPAWQLKVEGRLLEVSSAQLKYSLVNLSISIIRFPTKELRTAPRHASFQHSSNR